MVVPQDPEQRLAALMAIGAPDAARRIARDPAAARADFAALRRGVIDPLLAAHRGRCFNNVDFRLLVEFPSTELALHCAARLQRRLAEQNAALNPDADPREQSSLAISLHEGAVVERGRDLFGEAVQVVVGLAALARPGDIWMSEPVAREAREVLRLPLETHEPQQLRGVAYPIPAARVAHRALVPAAVAPGVAVHPALLRNDAPRPAPVPPEPAHHLLLPGQTNGPRSIGIGTRALVVGRLADCDVPLNGLEVSRRHCSLVLVEGLVVVTDLGSTNGTFLNGERLQAPATLRDGAEIRVGSHLLRYSRATRIDNEPTFVGGLSDWLAGPGK